MSRLNIILAQYHQDVCEKASSQTNRHAIQQLDEVFPGVCCQILSAVAARHFVARDRVVVMAKNHDMDVFASGGGLHIDCGQRIQGVLQVVKANMRVTFNGQPSLPLHLLARLIVRVDRGLVHRRSRPGRQPARVTIV